MSCARAPAIARTSRQSNPGYAYTRMHTEPQSPYRLILPERACTDADIELKPGKPGFANRCPECSEPEKDASGTAGDALKGDREAAVANGLVTTETVGSISYKLTLTKRWQDTSVETSGCDSNGNMRYRTQHHTVVGGSAGIPGVLFLVI